MGHFGGEDQIRTKDNLIGKKFGRLTVVARAPDQKNSVMWYCQCDCGSQIKAICGSALKNGKVKSCGCFKMEASSDRATKHNRFDLSGDFGIGFTDNDDVFYFDLEDYDKIKDYCWNKNHYGYFETHNKYKDSSTRSIIRLHNLIMSVDENSGVLVDHINGSDSLFDNRKSNLRLVDRTQNAMNKKIQSNNTSGVTGVYFAKNVNKWLARISLYNNTINLGYYDDFDDAVKARKDAEEKYFGEYSYDNSRGKAI